LTQKQHFGEIVLRYQSLSKNQKIFDSSLYTREPWTLPRQYLIRTALRMIFSCGGLTVLQTPLYCPGFSLIIPCHELENRL
ncbi:MAG: hypothetical protein IJ374_11645, partial [Lachnospiraceae bacterium]|nr:hypothetical protein [Lachnospiraceae bacterium]